MTEIVTGMSNAHNTIDPVKSSELEKHERFMIPGLRFATESWAGMKTRNEDRRVTSVKWFPGPVFAIFDGHGGTFSAEYLARHLIKTVASVIRQNIGNNALTFLEQSHDQSNQESDRKKALIEHLVLLRQQLAELETLKNLESTHSPDNLQNLLDHLTEAIAQIDHEVAQIDTVEAVRHQERMQWVGTHHGHFVKSFVEAFERMDMQLLQKNPSQDGSTALLAWFVADTVCFADNTRGRATRCKQLMDGLLLYLVNVGDCRAVMCRGGQGIALTSDHKPNRPDEQKRIEKAGGFVGKIAGIARVYSAAGAGLALEHETSTYLAVSRAFGDRSLKTPTRLVSPEPEITRVVVQDQDLFLVLACDGIWDVLSEQEVVDIALPHFNDAKAAADAIVKAAYKKGSVDNLTATVIQFGWKPDAQVFGYRTRRVRSKTTAIESSCARFEDATEEIDMFNL